jgi:hypothetical protein
MKNDEAAAWMNKRIYILWKGERRQVFQSRRALDFPTARQAQEELVISLIINENVIITPDPRLSTITPY